MSSPPRRILPTGGSGFVGLHLRTAFAAAYPGTAILAPAVDVRDAAAVATMVAAAAPEVCVHLAAVSAVGAAEQEEDQAWQVNLHGSLHLARAILRHAPDCQMLFVSTADAYRGAPVGGGVIDENTVLAPLGVVPWALHLTGPVYGLAATALGIGFLVAAVRVLRDRQDADGRSLTRDAPARAMFRYSLLYLAVLFAALAVDRLSG